MSGRRIQSGWIIALALITSTGIALPQQTMLAAAHSSETAPVSETADPQLQARYPRYKVEPQDVLLITFPLSPELNQAETVGPDGFISLQSAGNVHVQGMTVPEVEAAIKVAYKGILHESIVNVNLEDFQKPFFMVSGQVGKPGQYDLRSELTVTEAIAVAGGLEPTAKGQAFLFHRTSRDWLKVEKLDLKDILNGKHANEDAVVRPGDMIYIPEKFITRFRKYVPYGVNAGTYFAENQ